MDRKFYIHTLGCKVNQYESQAMREILVSAGYGEADAKEDADVLIVNTCTVTAEADRESKRLIGSFGRANPGAKIVATGCMAEKDARELSSLPNVAYILRNVEKDRIADVLSERLTDWRPSDLAAARSSTMKVTAFKGHSKAFVKIQDGCENRCSYCKVPLVRSDLRSKPIQDIVDEVGGLVAGGFPEIVLTGICLGAWGRDLFPEEIAMSMGLKQASIVDVLRSLRKLPGDFRIRLSSIEPRYVTDELICFMAGDPRICRHLHIPLQSGDDTILKNMNRPYTAGQYRELIDKVRSRMPGIAVTTDVLVGFPGESHSQFRNTVDFLKDIVPARTHIFTYSPREGTPAGAMAHRHDQDVLKERHDEMSAAALECAYLYRSAFAGNILNVLVETKRDKVTGSLKGYSDNYIKVHFDGPDGIMKTIVPVRVKDVGLTKTIGAYGG